MSGRLEERCAGEVFACVVLVVLIPSLWSVTPCTATEEGAFILEGGESHDQTFSCPPSALSGKEVPQWQGLLSVKPDGLSLQPALPGTSPLGLPPETGLSGSLGQLLDGVLPEWCGQEEGLWPARASQMSPSLGDRRATGRLTRSAGKANGSMPHDCFGSRCLSP